MSPNDLVAMSNLMAKTLQATYMLLARAQDEDSSRFIRQKLIEQAKECINEVAYLLSKVS